MVKIASQAVMLYYCSSSLQDFVAVLVAVVRARTSMCVVLTS